LNLAEIRNNTKWEKKEVKLQEDKAEKSEVKNEADKGENLEIHENCDIIKTDNKESKSHIMIFKENEVVDLEDTNPKEKYVYQLD